MGSRDVTCAVTHLPLQYMEPCRFIFLRQVMPWDEDQKGSWEQRWAKYLPVSLPVKGLYDGYGTVMAGYHKTIPEGHDSHHALFEPDAVLKFQIESLARVAEPLPPDEPLSGWSSFKGWPHTIESLMAACERGWLKLRLPVDREGETQTVRVSPYLVSERAWQAVIAPTSKRGIGITRARMERYDTDPVNSLRRIIQAQTERLRREAEDEKNENLDDECRALLREAADLLGEIDHFGLRDLGPYFENLPDVLVIGNDWEPKIEERKTLFEFQDEDWKKLADLTFDLRVFFFTMRTELRREFHPELYSDQFYYPDQGLDAHRMLLRYVEQWCLEIEEASKEDEDD